MPATTQGSVKNQSYPSQPTCPSLYQGEIPPHSQCDYLINPHTNDCERTNKHNYENALVQIEKPFITNIRLTTHETITVQSHQNRSARSHHALQPKQIRH